MPIRNATLINSIYFFEDIGINVYIHGICNWISHLASANVQITNIQLASWPDATNWRLSACNWPGPIKLMISYTSADYWPMMYGNYCPINTVSFHHHDIVSVMSCGLWLYKEGTLAIKPLVPDHFSWTNVNIAVTWQLLTWWSWEFTLQWRHNEHDFASNHQPHECLLYSLFRSRSKKTSNSASLAFVRGIHRGPVNSPHKGPSTRKMFPFDDVIMINWV